MSHIRNDGNTIDKDEARTPPTLFNNLKSRFPKLEIDVFCTKQNSLCLEGMFRDLEIDALSEDWTNWGFEDTIFYGNPPYSKPEPFIKKAYDESLVDVKSVLLIPADVSTSYWRNYCMKAAEWIIVEGRVRFNNPDGTPMKSSPKFGSVAIVFDHERYIKNNERIDISLIGWK